MVLNICNNDIFNLKLDKLLIEKALT